MKPRVQRTEPRGTEGEATGAAASATQTARRYSSLELSLFQEGITLLAGVDEAGRGPLAGPVVAAAVILPADAAIAGIADSKTLHEQRREELADIIRTHAVAIGIGEAGPEEIDAVNILQATLRAMDRAVAALDPAPDFLLVDGNRYRHATLPFRTVVRGDALCLSIGAASIIAKTHRDAILRALEDAYPGYGFAQHKGYATRKHLEAIRTMGYTPVHRRSFIVKQFLEHQGELFDGRQE